MPIWAIVLIALACLVLGFGISHVVILGRTAGTLRINRSNHANEKFFFLELDESDESWQKHKFVLLRISHFHFTVK